MLFKFVLVLVVAVIGVRAICPHFRFTEKHLCPQCTTVAQVSDRARYTNERIRSNSQQTNTETIFRVQTLPNLWQTDPRTNICSLRQRSDCYVVTRTGATWTCRSGTGFAYHSALDRNEGHLNWQTAGSCETTGPCRDA